MKQTCSVTGDDFVISCSEKEFLKRITPTFAGTGFAIPLPKLSPLERARLRTLHRNEQYLYRTTSAFSGKPLISIYPPTVKSPVISRTEWFSDSWDARDSGRSYDFERQFFEQFASLQSIVPRASMLTLDNENSEYTTGTAYCKNCYLINSSEYCEDCYYSKLLQNCRDVFDSSYCYDSELLYECFNLRNCYDCRWVYTSQQCNNCWFCDDLRNCRDCYLCTNLVGQQFCFLNQQLSRNEYREKVATLVSSRKGLIESLLRFQELRLVRNFKYAEILNCENCNGDFIRNSKDCEYCFDVVDSKDCMYVQVGIKTKDLLDCSNMYIDPELSYQVLGTIGTQNVHFSLYVFHSSSVWYCEQCFSCKNCFGCVGLRNKQYCILNQQYSKQDYENTVASIVQQMGNTGEWGQFFPHTMSPFAYNRTLANECYPLSKEEAIGRGYSWEEPEPADYCTATSDVPDNIEDVSDSIYSELFSCAESGKNYRIQRGELAFYNKMNLPIPKVCPDVRYQRRTKLRNPRKLWERSCDVCGEIVMSSYSPNRKERILCEKDYLAVVS